MCLMTNREAMMTLPESVLLQVQRLRDNLLLDEVDGHALDIAQRDAVLVTCSCCPDAGGIFRGHPSMRGHAGPARRFQTISLNGGPLLVAKESPLNHSLHEDRVIIEHLRQTGRLDNFGVIALLSHLPCLAVQDPILRVIDQLVRAKVRLKWELVGMKAACFLHVDDGTENGHLYFVSQDRWEAARVDER